jgi:hypothetical protein
MTPSQSLDGLLDGLPAGWLVGHRQVARLAIGPAGAFVLVTGDVDLAVAAARARDLAECTRAALAHHLSWVPFIDAAVVTSADCPAQAAAVLVASDLLTEFLVQGPVVIDQPAIAVLHGLLVCDLLDGWTVGTAPHTAKIDLCDPPLLPATAARR